ncbi:MAG: hypothetical protein GY950_23580 [bacterium]|nr:hypothetical protein [bacterium]
MDPLLKGNSSKPKMNPVTFNPRAPLPLFLKRVFTNKSLLFIGCSLAGDRTMKIMKSLKHMRPHFAVMRRPKKQKQLVELNRRLAALYITPIWIADFPEIEEILASLVETGPERSIGHGVPFVGRESQLSQMRENFESRGSGSVRLITGRFFSIQGAGGVGKTTLAIEAARRFGGMFADGVLPPIRVDEHSPMSFAVYLAGQLGVPVTEPADEVSAQALVTALLKKRHALVILDNAVEWKRLRYMLPEETGSCILVTTRGRNMCRHIRLAFSGLDVEEISLETFTREEALALFRRMLGTGYRAGEEETYAAIAENLGFLPIALRQAISLMLFGLQYPAPRLLEKLRAEDRLGLLRKGTAVEESDCRTLETVFDLSTPLLTPELIEALECLAVCAAGPAPLDFLGRLAGYGETEEMEERLERLVEFSWCERREREGKRFYELHQLVRELVRRRLGRRFGEAFTGLVEEIFLDESVHFSEKEGLYDQLEEAFLWAKEAKDKRLIKWMYSHDLYFFCTYRGFANFYVRLARVVEELFPDNKWALRVSYGHRALIFFNWGKLEEAMTLHKKEEEICNELGHLWHLAICLWNKGVIHNKKNDYKKQIQLWQQSIQIHKDIGIPTEEDEKRLEKLMKR